MKRLGLDSPVSLKTAVGLLALLVLLAALQYHWLGQVSRAERQRMEMNLRTAVGRMADDFNREMTRIFLYFIPDPNDRDDDLGRRYRERYDRWRGEAPFPELIRQVLVTYRSPDGTPELRRLDPAEGDLVRVDWPPEFAGLHRRIERSGGRDERNTAPPVPAFVDDTIPAIVLPAVPMRPRMEERPPGATTLVILELDLRFMRERFIPELARRHLSHGDEAAYDLVITSAREPGKVVYASRPEAESGGEADATAELFSIRLAQARRDFLLRDIAPMMPMMMERLAPPRGGRSGPGARWLPWLRGADGHWILSVRHRLGSLEAVIDRTRRRNLAVGFAILGLLAVSVIMILVSTERARELARQKIEFVAGVSHELKTPLSVIRSAGQNLADGTIGDTEQVKRYGALVESEGRRLTNLVDQVLLFSSGLAERNPYNLETASPLEIIESALGDCRAIIEEKRARVEKDLPSVLPPVRADRAALRRAIKNLLDNAIKFGGEEARIGLRARASGGRIEITVEDDGPGISKADLPHIFEPFYRGRSAAHVHGSGLGLGLVKQIAEAHGGRVRVESAPGRGSRFTINIPTIGE